jgi:hypothetical protein
VSLPVYILEPGFLGLCGILSAFAPVHILAL